MLKSLKKFWPFVTMLFTFVLLGSTFFFSDTRKFLSIVIMGLALAASLAFTVQKSVDTVGEGRLERSILSRIIALDIIGLFMIMGLAVPAGALAGRGAFQATVVIVEEYWPGWGSSIIGGMRIRLDWIKVCHPRIG